jgi:hypothetical protein
MLVWNIHSKDPKHVVFIDGIIKSLLHLTVVYMPVFSWIVSHSVSLINWG